DLLGPSEAESGNQHSSASVYDRLHRPDESCFLPLTMAMALLAVGGLDDQQIGVSYEALREVGRLDGQVVVVQAADVTGDDYPLVTGGDDDSGGSEDVSGGEQDQAEVAYRELP